MVEFFGEKMDGFFFTQNGWVQSYGSRCVKPPIIYGDVSRPEAMTVNDIVFAQNQTDRVMKAMLTGPVTILNWSFVRDDMSLQDVCHQIAVGIRKEVLDLEQANIKVIQVDEAALREGLPLREENKQSYLDWAVESFQISVEAVEDKTQIHTHMCYSEFNEILDSIIQMDADVISIENSRGQEKLLQAFTKQDYPNHIGPGVYDIHSPNIPSVEEISQKIEKIINVIPIERVWINPDCGLKTRQNKEAIPSLKNMVEATQLVREKKTIKTI